MSTSIARYIRRDYFVFTHSLLLWLLFIWSLPTLNKAVYTTAPVAGGWAGAVMSWAGAVMSWAGAE